jgi:hypothetical protein
LSLDLRNQRVLGGATPCEEELSLLKTASVVGQHPLAAVLKIGVILAGMNNNLRVNHGPR